ncbi:unnamed protein product [Angiostrongylus costaricensis]|uniref:Biogenesis of lysosome-related organelles complex 1 subunit 1 n=1 Tax=Angiostrongylus costaricensis TaxID=334426 RepID=A0A158PJ66_ANGCS|nr:unnamed protein product [Angiostrongylus costaricensis]
MNVAVYERKNDESAAEKESANKQLANEKPMEESGKSEQNSERTDSGCSLGADNTQIQLVIAETENKECSEVYMSNLGNILETANNYMWAMKKHMAADQAAWKELAKRITLLRAEVMITSTVFTIFCNWG